MAAAVTAALAVCAGAYYATREDAPPREQAAARHTSAVYAEAVKRDPWNAALLADYAEALALAQGRSFAGEPERLLQKALSIDPDNLKAAGMAGRAAFDRADYQAALTFWRRMLDRLPPDSDLARRLTASIADAQRRLERPAEGAAQP